MPSWNLNPYGLRNGQIVSVEDLDENTEFGLRCNCTCPSCGDPLIARIRGKKKEKHFAHKSGADCGKAYESALHRLAKQIIEEGVEINLPPITSSYGDKGFFVIDGIVKFPASFLSTKPIIPDEGETVVEKDMGAFRPDVSIKHNGKELFIEIQVTHPVDDEKKKLIQEKKISCIEFDFSYYKNVVLEESDIRKAFEGKDENVEVRWIYNRIIEEQDSIIQSNLETSLLLDSYKSKPKRGTALSEVGFMHEIVNNKDKVLNCPLRKHLDGKNHYANKGECADCEGFSGFLFALKSETPFSILCSKGDNNVKVYPKDAARWLIYLSNNQKLPHTKEECVELVESNMEKLGPLSDHTYVKNAKERAIENILSRLEKKKERELKEKRDKDYRALYRSIYQSLNSLIFWANSTFEVWSKFAYKKVFDDLPEYLLKEFSQKGADSIVYTLSQKVWDLHCNEGERLFKAGDVSFRTAISFFIVKPIYFHELQKDWLYRVTYDLFQNGRGSYRFIVPIHLMEDNVREISILPFLEKVTKSRFEQKELNEAEKQL